MAGFEIAITAHWTPVTLASMAVALLGLLVALAIFDCTEAAVAVGVWMLTSTMTLPEVTATSTADGWTPASAAIAEVISTCTLGVNEEISPASLRVNATTLIAGGGGAQAPSRAPGGGAMAGCRAPSRALAAGGGGGGSVSGCASDGADASVEAAASVKAAASVNAAAAAAHDDECTSEGLALAPAGIHTTPTQPLR